MPSFSRTVRIAAAQFSAALGVLSGFVKAGLASSTREARRQIKAGVLKVNDNPVTDERATLSQADLSNAGTIKLSLGRKRHVLLRPE